MNLLNLVFLGFLSRIPGVSEDSHHVLERTLPTETPSLPTCPPPAQKNSTSPLQQPPQVGFDLVTCKTFGHLGNRRDDSEPHPPDLDSPGQLSGRFFLPFFFFLFRRSSLHSLLPSSPNITRTTLLPPPPLF